MKKVKIPLLPIVLAILFVANNYLLAGEKSQRYMRFRFVKEERIVVDEGATKGFSYISIDKPKFHVNCDKSQKIRFVGRITYADGEVAKSYPILDAATMEVWYTDQKGAFNFQIPGNCNLIVTTRQKRVATAFRFMGTKQSVHSGDIVVADTAFITIISEEFPRKTIEKAFLGLRESGSAPNKESTCFTGLIPQEFPEFRIFALDEAGKEYFQGSDYDTFFEVRIPVNMKFNTLAYTNQPGNKIYLFKGFRDLTAKGQIHEKANKSCIPVIFKKLGEYSHQQLEKEGFLAPMLSGQ